MIWRLARRIRALEKRLDPLETRLKIERELQVARRVNQNFREQVSCTGGSAGQLARASMSVVNFSATTQATRWRTCRKNVRDFMEGFSAAAITLVIAGGVFFGAVKGVRLLLQTWGH